jgi:hypothetical protein
MKSPRILPGVIVVGAVAIASMFAAAPASAATLPAGQKITVVDTDDDQFYNVNPANAESAPVGTPAGVIREEIEGVDVDDTGLGYAVATYYADIEDPGEFGPYSYPAEGWIYKADANTGAVSDGKQVLIDTGDEILTVSNECAAIDYSKGVILAVCFTYDGETEFGTAYIGPVDVSGDDAILDAKTTLEENFEFNDFLHFTAIAVNPVTGVIYGFDDERPAAWTITLDDQYPTLLDFNDDYYVLGADFDRGGQLWLSVASYSIPSLLANVSFLELATFDFTSNQPVSIDNFSSADPYEIESPQNITVWGALAATGSTMSPVAPVIASGILLLGALMAAGTMVLRRRSAGARV